MRTSNKILLAGFLLAVLIITGVHVAIYARIKNGDLHTVERRMEPATERFQIGNIKHVLVKGMEECRIHQSDTAALDMPKNWAKTLRHRVVGDTLFIEGGKSESEFNRGARSFMPVDVYLPAVESIVSIHSRLQLFGGADSSKNISRSFKLFSSDLWLLPGENDSPNYLDSVNVLNSVESNVGVNNKVTVKDMQALLSANSRFDDQGAKFGTITLQVDSSSSANLRTGSLSKLKFIKL